ncbi:MAG: ECF transporter S component [Bacilli bacterium]|nr:ECF transporter S component [Bacilli bacterium]MBO4682640.1 ECF transporter S component [Bacilli bacterium]
MKNQRSAREIITRMTTLAMLSALGFVLMAFAQFPYPLAPWLKIEVSEIVTIIAYALYGLPGGLTVAIIKTALNLAVHGPVGLGIGDLTALFTSMMFVFGLFLTSHVFKWFKKGLGFRILAYVVIVLIITVTLTALNAIFITPSYLTVFGPDAHFSTCFEEGVINNVTSYITGKEATDVNGWTYVGLISSIYGPFNLMKAGACFFIYELMFNRLIFVFMRKSEFFQKYFVGSIFVKKKEENVENIVDETTENEQE